VSVYSEEGEMARFSEDSDVMRQRASDLGRQADEYDSIKKSLHDVATTMGGYESGDNKAFVASITNLCAELATVSARLRNADAVVKSQASSYDQREGENTQRASRLPQ
jgi:hypothetical protein